MKYDPYVSSLKAYVEAADYSGYDPYDALNSPFLSALTGKSKWLRIAAIQALRKLPINLRPLLGVKKGHNPKGLALFIWGYARLYALDGHREHLRRIEYLLELLEGLKSKGFSGNGWGYNFDWQNRVMFVAKYTPTIVNSAFVGHALLDAYSLCHIKRALDMAVPIKDFIANDLNRLSQGDRLCFSYTPVDDNYVHNANLLGASLLIRLHQMWNVPALEHLSLASLRYSLNHQRDDGAWNYAEKTVQNWVDSFHTGFNLQALQYFIDAGYGSLCGEAYELGLKYYRANFFLGDGTPKYYDTRVFPIDIHSPCQAIVVLTNPLAGDLPLAEKIIEWMLRHMYDERGYFYFRKGRFLSNRIPYMRWSQAWVFHALTSFLYNRSTRPCQD